MNNLYGSNLVKKIYFPNFYHMENVKTLHTIEKFKQHKIKVDKALITAKKRIEMIEKTSIEYDCLEVCIETFELFLGICDDAINLKDIKE